MSSVMAGAPVNEWRGLCTYLQDVKVRIIYGQTYRLVRQARAALVTSGTATLETAILRTPQSGLLQRGRGGWCYFLLKTFVKVEIYFVGKPDCRARSGDRIIEAELNERTCCGNSQLEILPEARETTSMLDGYDGSEREIG